MWVELEREARIVDRAGSHCQDGAGRSEVLECLAGLEEPTTQHLDVVTGAHHDRHACWQPESRRRLRQERSGDRLAHHDVGQEF
jgi:hypothetical protein